jgi:hypothetical protein
MCSAPFPPSSPTATYVQARRRLGVLGCWGVRREWIHREREAAESGGERKAAESGVKGVVRAQAGIGNKGLSLPLTPDLRHFVAERLDAVLIGAFRVLPRPFLCDMRPWLLAPTRSRLNVFAHSNAKGGTAKLVSAAATEKRGPARAHNNPERGFRASECCHSFFFRRRRRSSRRRNRSPSRRRRSSSSSRSRRRRSRHRGRGRAAAAGPGGATGSGVGDFIFSDAAERERERESLPPIHP